MSDIISQEYLDKLQQERDIEGVYLANSLQQGFIYHALNQGDIDDAYIVQIMWQYNTHLEVNKLREAWSYAQKRYSSLRLRFAWEEELVQIIDKKGNLDWRYIDLSNDLDITTQELQIKQLQEIDRLEPYRLEQGNLFRIYLIKQKDDLYTCIFSNHHAILDGWSSTILLNYIHDTYLKLHDEKTIILSIDRTYEYTQRYLQEHQNVSKDYWDSYISKIEERSDLSGLLLRANNTGLRLSEYKHIIHPDEQTLIIEDKLYTDLKKLSRKEEITLNAILQYAWHKVLYIYGNSNHTVVGTTVSGRNLPIDDIESSVGLYINTLPLIIDHQSQATLKIIESIKNIQDNINEMNSRSEVSLAKLQKDGERLFDSLFVYENYPNPINQEQNNRLNISFNRGIDKLDYPLVVIAYELNNQVVFKLKYAGELFSKDCVELLLSIVKILLEQIVTDINQRAQNLRYLNKEQYNQIIYDWNKTDKDYPDNKTIHQLFEEQVERTPDNIAVVYEDINLTYRELNNRANQLAHYLISLGVNSNILVAIMLERSIDFLISMLAVFKAGGAYLPIDPILPKSRIESIVYESNPNILLTRKTYITPTIEFNKTITRLELFEKLLFNNKNILNLNILVASNALAYVIYTSGSTGKPKGAMLEHRGILNHLMAKIEELSINVFDKIAQTATQSFDVSVWQFISALAVGGTTIIFKDNSAWEPSKLIELIKKEKITVFQTVPTHMRVILNEIEGNALKSNKLNSLRWLIINGEPLLSEICSRWFNLHPTIPIINAYGPTECSDDVTHFKIFHNLDEYFKVAPISGTIFNTKVYVLDSYLNPMPIGAVGELFIGGVGVGRGYLNRPELTAEKFIANPFLKEKDIGLIQYQSLKLYRTGDLVRFLSDGNIEFLGRIDDQVKIRGFRVELGEIESVLSNYYGIKQSAILAKKDRNIDKVSINEYLVGYYTSETKLNEDGILNYLQERLPAYMLPSVLIHLENLPLTINGKLDKKALPDPSFNISDSYLAPRNELEKQVCKIWVEILGLAGDRISVNDNFFRLGGNSIAAIRLVSKLNKELNSSINISAIFSYNTVDKLARYLEHNTYDLDKIGKEYEF